MKTDFYKKKPFIIAVVIAITGFGFLGFQYFNVSKEFEQARNNFFSDKTKLEDKIKDLEGKLTEALEENTKLGGRLEEEIDKNEFFEEQIGEIAGTVGDLEKLSKTDEELLQKYSKVYFLNENYMPDNLAEIDGEFLYNENQESHLIHRDVRKFLYRMFDDAEDDDIELRVVSAYRSFGTQSSLKAGYKALYGSGANQFSADQGYSEHQLGTTVDLTITEIGGGFTGIEETPAYEWLLDNAYKYGFILSYPEGNSYYQFEPWHWRFVGVDLADELHDSGQSFYDMNQREIDTYLLNIFD